jgi:anaerobic magnesium-protoporphyrin IX monomethyl ester cyclase
MSFDRVLLVMPSGRHGLGYAMDVIPTGLEYLAARIEDRVAEVAIVDLKMEDRPVDDFLRRLKPDLVGISMCATEHSEGLAIARKAKKLGMATMVGNYHPTGLAPFFASHPDIDFVVRGEGEETLLELIDKGQAQGVLGVSYRNRKEVVHNPDRPLIENLDALPFPARHLRRRKYSSRLDGKRKRDVLTISRGCRGQCTFCCEPSMNKGFQRYRSPDNVLQEIIEVYEWHGERPLSLHLTDPNALGDAGVIEELCDRLISLRLDIEMICHIRADKVTAHPDVVAKMVKAGFVSFEMGIESPNPADLCSTRKGFGADVHEKACRILRRCGAQPLGTFVIGLPEQTEKEILAFPDYGRRIGLSQAAFGIATPFPGTEFYRELDESGLIFENDWNQFDEMHSVFHCRHIPDKRVESLASRCMSKFWTIDKLLDMENLERMRTGKKRSLSGFGRHLVRLLETGQNAIQQLQNDHFISHIIEFVKEAPDDSMEDRTRRLKIHEIIDMDRFLRILGDQTIEITLDHKSRPLTSWVLELKDRAVDGIKVIPGEVGGATMHFRFDIAAYERDPRPSPGRKILLLWKLLNSNKGLARRINLARLLLAVALG